MISNEQINALRNKSGALQSDIIKAEANNAHRAELTLAYDGYIAKAEALSQTLTGLKNLKKITMSEMDAHRDAILHSLEQRVESILRLILPEEDFKIKITYQAVRGKYQSEVLIGKEDADGKIIWSRPKGTNGGFMKQLISFSILASIDILLHSKFLFMDEPFSSSDIVNVSKMKPIFDLMLDQGLQLLFIEHKKELYEAVDHNLIHLFKHRSPSDTHAGYVEVERVEKIYGASSNNTAGAAEISTADVRIQESE